jgi:hypothetical protein
MLGVGNTASVTTQENNPASRLGFPKFIEHLCEHRAFFYAEQPAIKMLTVIGEILEPSLIVVKKMPE